MTLFQSFQVEVRVLQIIRYETVMSLKSRGRCVFRLRLTSELVSYEIIKGFLLLFHREVKVLFVIGAYYIQWRVLW